MKRELVITAEGRERTVVLEPIPGEAGRFRGTIDGVEHAVDARMIRPGTWSLVVDGNSFLVDLDKRRAGVAATVGDSEALLVVEDALQRRLAQATSGGRAHASGEQVKAPIAGKVVKIEVAVGDVVPVGAGLVVLEAMKMENEIVAERGGTVTQIHKAPGQAVETGDLLITLE